jgi:hypothetical protein
MDLKQRIKLMIDVQNVCHSLKNDLKGKFYRIKDMNERDKKSLKQNMFDETLIKNDVMKEMNMFGNWPYGRGIYSNDP